MRVLSAVGVDDTVRAVRSDGKLEMKNDVTGSNLIREAGFEIHQPDRAVEHPIDLPGKG